MTGDPSLIHETAVIDAKVMIGHGTRVWHFCHLMSGCTIGNDCVLGQNTFVAGTVTIGNRVRIQNNVSLYDGVQIDDDVFIGPSAVFTNVRNPRAQRPQKHNYLHTRIATGATIGANATIVCGITIGAFAFIGAGAVITSDVPAHALMLGVPAIQKGIVCPCGERIAPGSTCAVCQWTAVVHQESIQ
ncbi:MAG: N-acetyltransferase [Deltaproteobacteria bacterium]|nr:N-acetyltransferase [Deltaproteobacteria bacterium]